MKANLKNIALVTNEVINIKTRSAWAKGVKYYAERLLEDFAYFASYDDEVNFDEKTALNGAGTWQNWSYGGCGYCYDYQIAETLCTPTELKLTKNGQRNPNSRETWLDVQARAAYQGWLMIKSAINTVERKQQEAVKKSAAMYQNANVIFEDYTETNTIEEKQVRKTA